MTTGNCLFSNCSHNVAGHNIQKSDVLIAEVLHAERFLQPLWAGTSWYHNWNLLGGSTWTVVRDTLVL